MLESPAALSVAVTPEGSPSAQEFTAGSGSSLEVGGQSIGFTAVVHDATVNGSIIGLVTPGQPTAHECRKETGSGTGGLYADGTCSAGGGKSEFERVPITGSQTVVPRLTSETVAFGVPFLAGSNFPVVCTGLTSSNSKIENASPGGKMEVKGTGVLRLTGCKPDGEILGCKLTSETIETGSSTSTNETQTTFSGVSLSVTLTKCEVGNGKHTASGSIAAISRESTPYVLEFTTSSGTSLTWNNKFTAVIDLETEDGTKVGLETP